MDLTLVYYTANRVQDSFAEEVRKCLMETTEGKFPLISVSQKPLNFGKNICLGDIGYHAYNVYKQVLIGALEVNTEFFACCEDDCLYHPDHFKFVPPKDAFAYDLNRWTVENWGEYWWRDRTNMGMCIVRTELAIETLRTKFDKFPTPITERKALTGWGEPGRYEKHLGLPPVGLLHFHSEGPSVTFNHKPSLGGKRRINPTDIRKFELPYWGSGKSIWERFYG